MLLAACEQAPRPAAAAARSSNAPLEAKPVAPEPKRSMPELAAPKLSEENYPWLADGDFELEGMLEARFEPPQGFTREPLAEGSFGAWLRALPLTKQGSPVRTYRGDVLHPASDGRIAAVVAIDIGKGDLQQCADAIIRMHAEWSWWRGKRDQSYRAAAGMDLPYARYARGERIVPNGASISWQPGGKASSDHPGFRRYLDSVFAWANTVSLERQAKPVPFADVRPGDFFILPGNPGHSVLVLDIASNGQRRVALLGQSFMPAQSFQVLRSKTGSPWFTLDPESDVDTPFWKPFPWSSLRRLD